jgi:O-antigen ligase
VLRDEPLFGFGYYAASRVLAPQYNPSLGNAHSVFFEVLVGGGLISAALYVALCVSLLMNAGRLLAVARGEPAAVATVGLFAFTLVLGLTSTESFHAGPVGFTFWSMTAILPVMCRAAESRAVFARQRLRLQRRAMSRAQPATRRPSLSS